MSKNIKWLVVLLLASPLLVALMGSDYWDIPPKQHGLPPGFGQLGLSPEAAHDSRWYPIGGLASSQVLWQVRVTRTDLRLIVGSLKLQTVGADRMPLSFPHQPPYWWHPTQTPDTRYFADPNWSDTDHISDDVHAFAAYEPQTGLLHLWERSVF